MKVLWEKETLWAPVKGQQWSVSAVFQKDLGRLDASSKRLCSGYMCEEMVRKCVGVSVGALDIGI